MINLKKERVRNIIDETKTSIDIEMIKDLSGNYFLFTILKDKM
jgi:hypothetical protein